MLRGAHAIWCSVLLIAATDIWPAEAGCGPQKLLLAHGMRERSFVVRALHIPSAGGHARNPGSKDECTERQADSGIGRGALDSDRWIYNYRQRWLDSAVRPAASELWSAAHYFQDRENQRFGIERLCNVGLVARLAALLYIVGRGVRSERDGGRQALMVFCCVLP